MNDFGEYRITIGKCEGGEVPPVHFSRRQDCGGYNISVVAMSGSVVRLRGGVVVADDKLFSATFLHQHPGEPWSLAGGMIGEYADLVESADRYVWPLYDGDTTHGGLIGGRG